MDMLSSSPYECEAVAAKGSPAHIYLVDDDASVRSALMRLLDAAGFRVSAFGTSESFLARHDPHEHGCLVLHVSLPGLDGRASQQAMGWRSSQMPIIFLAGQADVPMCARAMKQGAFDFLTKPVDDSVLLST